MEFSFFLGDVGTKLTREVTCSKGVQGTEEFLVTFCNQKFVSEEFNVKKKYLGMFFNVLLPLQLFILYFSLSFSLFNVSLL